MHRRAKRPQRSLKPRKPCRRYVGGVWAGQPHWREMACELLPRTRRWGPYARTRSLDALCRPLADWDCRPAPPDL